MTDINRGIYRLTIGDFTVTALNDGQFQAPAEWVIGVDAADLERLLGDAFRPFPPRITLNAFLVQHGDSTILIDSGAGGKFGAGMGAVGRHLRTLGVAPNTVETILLTHAHVDHVGGLTDDTGKALFPHATLAVNQFESDFWHSDANRAEAPEGAKGSFDAARVALDAYKDRVRLIGDGIEVVPGIRAKALPGHTPGHTGYVIGTGADALLIWGDIVHLPGVQYARTEVGMAFDADPGQAIETRDAVLEQAAAERFMIAGMHLDFPTFGHIRRHAGVFELVPSVWAPDA